MSETKKLVMDLLDTIPDTATLEDIQYHIYVQEKIRRGILAYDEGRVLTEAEVDEKVKKWIIN